eukprot:g5740.t1
MAQRISKDSVSKQFVRLYYSILNTHHEHLHQFYGKGSTIVVSETLDSGETMTEAAEDEEVCRELLNWLYEDVTVKVESAVPQFTVEGCVLLLVNGIMYRKSQKDERLFTQALLLAPQDNGYYIRTDTLQVLRRLPSGALIESDSKQTSSNPQEKELSGCESPKTPRTETAQCSMRQGTDSGRTSVEITSQGNSQEIQTATPPPQENSIDASKSSGSDADGEEFQQPGIKRTMSHGTGEANQPQIMRRTIPPPMHSLPPMMMPNLPMMPPMGSMAMGMGMHPNQPGLRRRSMSMSCDIRTMQSSSGHGVFIARLPFGIQAKDVAEAFQEFGPIVGGIDGIQVRDGRNGCYAFVNFVSSSSAESAVQNGATVQGKRVYVEPRYQRSDVEMVFPVPVMSSEHAARPPLPVPRRAT